MPNTCYRLWKKYSKRGFVWFLKYTTVLHLLPFRFHCDGGCWDWTHDCCRCDFGIIRQTLKPLGYKSHTFSARSHHSSGCSVAFSVIHRSSLCLQCWGKGWRGHNSDDLRKSLVLCLLCVPPPKNYKNKYDVTILLSDSFCRLPLRRRAFWIAFYE